MDEEQVGGEMDRFLECGHPIPCLRADGLEIHCGWCEDVRQLREENNGLRAQLQKDAIVVNEGEFCFDGKEIGFLEVRGGTVHLGTGHGTTT